MRAAHALQMAPCILGGRLPAFTVGMATAQNARSAHGPPLWDARSAHACAQRLCMEHKVRLGKVDNVFITRMAAENVGGLPGAHSDLIAKRVT